MLSRTQPQREMDELRLAESISALPSNLDTALAPPIPKRFEIAERSMKAGVHMVRAVTLASSPVRLIKKGAGHIIYYENYLTYYRRQSQAEKASGIDAFSKRFFPEADSY